MEVLERDLKAVVDSYIKKLLENAKALRFLNTHHRDILSEFEMIGAAETL